MNYICIANNQNDNLYKFKGTLYEIEYDGSKEIKLAQNNGYQGQWSALLNNEDYSSISNDLFTIIKSYSIFNS